MLVPVLWFSLGLVLLIFGGDWFVDGAVGIAQRFTAFQRFIPWIALALLLYIGGSMLLEGIRHKAGDDPPPAVGPVGLVLQGVATSIDALSVGFTIAEYTFPAALTSALIIATVTFFICLAGLRLGKQFGTRLAGKASLLGGEIGRAHV